MKLSNFWFAGILFFLCNACSTEVDFGEQYKKQIYIVNGNNRYVETEFAMDEEVEGFVTFYCSGTEGSSRNIEVRYKTDPEALQKFNATEYGDNPAKSLVCLPEEVLTFHEPVVTIPAGKEYAALKFTIRTAELDPGLNYAIPITITYVSDYEIIQELKTLFYKVKLMTAYTGMYNSVVKIYNGFDYETTKYVQKRVTAASKTSIKVPFMNNKETETGSNDYITVQLDEATNQLTLSSEVEGFGNVSSFMIFDNGWVTLDINYYNPETKEFILGYKYQESGKSLKMIYEVIQFIE